MILSQDVPISLKSRTLLRKITVVSLDNLNQTSNTVLRSDLIQWLITLPSSSKREQFLVESLRASLLHDLRRSLLPDDPVSIVRPRTKRSRFNTVLFWLLTIGGSLLAICDGYDGVAALTPILSVPLWIGRVVVGIFVLLSVASFYAFDIGQISENLGVKFPETSRLLDVLLEQAQEVYLMRKQIKRMMKTVDEGILNELVDLVHLLRLRQQALNELQAAYDMQLNKRYVKAAKFVMSLFIGALYFCGGFFVSQSSAAVAFLSLFGLSASAMALPVLVISVVIGLAAFGLYWFVQRPGVDDLVGRLFGLDKHKIASLNKFKTDPLTEQEVTVADKIAQLQQQVQKAKAVKTTRDCGTDTKDLEPTVQKLLFCHGSTQTPLSNVPVESTPFPCLQS